MGRFLILVGLLMAAVGVAIQMGLPLGRLPGDVVIRREHSTIYIPIATSILLSVILSVALMLLRR